MSSDPESIFSKHYWWATYQTLRHGKYEVSWFNCIREQTLGFHGATYYDGYHISLNTGIVNIYVYW